MVHTLCTGTQPPLGVHMQWVVLSPWSQQEETEDSQAAAPLLLAEVTAAQDRGGVHAAGGRKESRTAEAKAAAEDTVQAKDGRPSLQCNVVLQRVP